MDRFRCSKVSTRLPTLVKKSHRNISMRMKNRSVLLCDFTILFQTLVVIKNRTAKLLTEKLEHNQQIRLQNSPLSRQGLFVSGLSLMFFL